MLIEFVENREYEVAHHWLRSLLETQPLHMSSEDRQAMDALSLDLSS